MFDFGFSEMVVVALVGLIVLGPDRMPKVARQVGQWIGKLQRYVSDVKSDINRQMELDELRKLQTEMQSAASDLERSVQSTINETESSLNQAIGGADSAGYTPASQPATDWDKVYEARRTRDRIRERRIEREKQLGMKRPKRRI